MPSSAALKKPDSPFMPASELSSLAITPSPARLKSQSWVSKVGVPSPLGPMNALKFLGSSMKTRKTSSKSAMPVPRRGAGEPDNSPLIPASGPVPVGVSASGSEEPASPISVHSGPACATGTASASAATPAARQIRP